MDDWAENGMRDGWDSFCIWSFSRGVERLVHLLRLIFWGCGGGVCILGVSCGGIVS